MHGDEDLSEVGKSNEKKGDISLLLYIYNRLVSHFCSTAFLT